MKSLLKIVLFMILFDALRRSLLLRRFFKIAIYSGLAVALLPYRLFAADFGADLPVISFPEKWQMTMLEQHSPIGKSILEFHNGALFIVSLGIALVVLSLIIFICFRFSARRNPTPSKLTHNTLVEIIWTTLPTVILLFLFVPSIKLIFLTDHIDDAEITVKVIGNQWFWSYEYPDEDGLSLTSIMIPEEQAVAEGKMRLMDTDNPLVLPIDTRIRLLVTSNDVIHSWSVPSLGSKMDAVPGQLNETWTSIDTEGVYYGFCTELCGKDHSYMPVHIIAVTPDKYQSWLTEAKIEQGLTTASPIDDNDSSLFASLASFW